MTFFITAVLLLLGVLNLVQAQCEEYSIKPDIENLCQKDQLKDPRIFADPDDPSNYYKCIDNELKLFQCELIPKVLYFDPVGNKCSDIALHWVVKNSVCPDNSMGQKIPYLSIDSRNHFRGKNLSFPLFGYFALCGDKKENSELKVCYGEGLECIFNKDEETCEKKKP